MLLVRVECERCGNGPYLCHCDDGFNGSTHESILDVCIRTLPAPQLEGLEFTHLRFSHWQLKFAFDAGCERANELYRAWMSHPKSPTVKLILIEAETCWCLPSGQVAFYEPSVHERMVWQ